jgi:hypothetical protein
MMYIRTTLTLIFATVFVGQAQAATNAWDGFVTDTHCGTNCQRTSAMTPDKACVRLCVRKGSKFGFTGSISWTPSVARHLPADRRGGSLQISGYLTNRRPGSNAS